MSYDHLLPPEQPRGNRKDVFRDLDCFPSPIEGWRNAAVEIVGAAYVVNEAANEMAGSISLLVIAGMR